MEAALHDHFAFVFLVVPFFDVVALQVHLQLQIGVFGFGDDALLTRYYGDLQFDQRLVERGGCPRILGSRQHPFWLQQVSALESPILQVLGVQQIMCPIGGLQIQRYDVGSDVEPSYI